MNKPDTKITLVEAVKAHAYENYEKGWDTIVECYTDAELARLIGRAATAQQAIDNVARRTALSAWNEKRDWIQGWADKEE
jgi:hypothetical protein